MDFGKYSEDGEIKQADFSTFSTVGELDNYDFLKEDSEHVNLYNKLKEEVSSKYN